MKIMSILLILILLLTQAQSTNQYNTNPLNFNFILPNEIVLDGTISPGEWDNANVADSWYMDADPENYDGYNYMYLAEDRDNLYVGLDMISDITGGTTSEWVGLWFNTNNSTSSLYDYETWENSLDNGFESLIYDVENLKTMSFFNTTGNPDYIVKNPTVDNIFTAVEGSLKGNYTDLLNYDTNYLTVESGYNGTDYTARLDLSIDLSKLITILPNMYLDEIQEIRFLSYYRSNVTVSNSQLCTKDSNGAIYPNNNTYCGSNSLTTSYGSYYTFAYPENYTTPYTSEISYIASNAAPFRLEFETIRYEIITTGRSYISNGGVAYPYSSIKNYDIAFDFGPSANNASNHRMFEFRIPKTEFEGYSSDKPLGVIVGGYGTLAAWPNTHNWVYANTETTGIPFEYSAEYNYYDSFSMKGWTPLTDPVLSVISPSDTGDITLNWTDNNSNNFTLLRHTVMITEENAIQATIMATDLDVYGYVDSGLQNGTYYYAVVAFDDIGYGYLSNSIEAVVAIPSPNTSPSNTSSDTSPSNTNTPKASSDDTSEAGFLSGFTISICLVVLPVMFLRRYKQK